LHIAQPALSRQIQALEQQLGTKLLERDRRSVQRAARGTKALVVGFRTGIIPTGAVKRFSDEHPDVTVEVQRLEWDDQEQAVLGGRVDIAYVRRPVDERGLKLTRLYSERRLAALRADHPLAGREALTVADLEPEHHLRYLEPVKTGPTRTTILRSVEEKLEYVAAGHGIIVLPLSLTSYYTRQDIVYVPVTDAEPDEVLLAHEAARRSKLITAFVAAARAESS
jgi:DNA-binding transcriptional LysR family regulator